MNTKFEQLFWDIHSIVWDDYFNHPEYQKNMKSLISCLVDKKKQDYEKIIDLGCGTGNYSFELAHKGFSVLGVDFSRKMVEKAIRKINDCIRNKINFQSLDINQPLPFSSNSFDHAICIHVFQVLKDPAFFLAQLQKIIKPNGYFLIVVKDLERRDESKIKLKKSFTRIIISLLKKVLNKKKTIRKYGKEELKLVLNSSGFEVVKECPFTGAIGLLAQNQKDK